MSLPSVSCVCPTFNRIDKLEETIECFIKQDYQGATQLIILNDCPTQKLSFLHPDIHICNSDTQYESLGKKHADAVTMSDGEFIMIWDDDDIRFPNAISHCVSQMKLHKTPLYYPKDTLILYDDVKFRIINSSHFHLNGMWTRDLYDAVGGYSDGTESADCDLQNKFLALLKSYVPYDMNASDFYTIYRMHPSVKQISYNIRDTISNSDGCKAYRKMILDRAIPGTYELKPHWDVDYEKMARCAIKSNACKYDIYSIIYEREENKVTIYAQAGALTVDFINKRTGVCIFTDTGISVDDINSNWFCCRRDEEQIINISFDGTLRYCVDTATGIVTECGNMKPFRKISNPLKLIADFADLTGKKCVEIGVLRGEFSMELAKCNPEKLVLVDCWKHQSENYDDIANTQDNIQEENYQHVKAKFSTYGNVEIIRDFSISASEKFEDGCFDFVYIDANHGFHQCLADIEAWYKKVKSGGYICGHDLPWASVRCAVQTFCNKNNLSYQTLTRDSWGIRKPV